MFTRQIQKLMKRQEGQALVLACLAVLILSIAVITTVNLGHTIHERIRLQNNADAAAYSMAAMEARAFNFYAFTNRAEASHYVSAMQWQSVLSFFFFVEAFVTDVYGILRTFDPCGGSRNWFWSIVCPIIEAIPYVGEVIEIINEIISIVERAVKALQTGVFKPANQADWFIGTKIIPAHRMLNQALSVAAQTIMYSSLSHVGSMSKDVILDNDANIDPTWGAAMAGVLSSCMYSRAHDGDVLGTPLGPKSVGNPLQVNTRREDNKENRAKRVMAQIANATRYGCEGTDSGASAACPEKFVTDRGLGGVLGFLPSAIQDFLDGFPKWGQTKLLGYDQAEGKNQNYIHRGGTPPPNNNYGVLASGDDMGSDDLYEINIGPDSFGPFDNPLACDDGKPYYKCWGDNRVKDTSSGDQKFRTAFKTSIWALNDSDTNSRRFKNGIHWRLQYDQPHTSCRSRNCGFSPPKCEGGGFFGIGCNNPVKDMGINQVKLLKICPPIIICPPSPIPDPPGSFDLYKWTANVEPIYDDNHPWWGMVRFPHFEPREYSRKCPISGNPALDSPAKRSQEFNQPSTWVLLNKSPDQMKNPNADTNGVTHTGPAMLNDQSKFSFAMGANSETELVFDDTRKKFGVSIFSTNGINAISRGQAYYHRPGNWTEQPNFFNPFWRPRLAAVYQGAQNVELLDDVINRLPGPTAGIPQKIITH